jgi:Ca2+-transporting ATPase
MHVPIAGISLLPALFGWPILLYPMHIAFLELIIDPACSLAFENEAAEEDAMRQPPRDPTAPLLGVRLFLQPILQGMGALLLLALGYLWAVGHLPEDQARAAGFTVIVVANLALIFSNLSHRRSALHALRSTNRVPVLVALTAFVFLGATLYVPALAGAFRFLSPSPAVLGGAVALGLGSLLWFEAVKFRAGKHLAVRTGPA